MKAAIGLFLLSWLLAGCLGPPDRPSNASVLAENPHLSLFQIKIEDTNLSGVQTQQQCDSAVLFIHGTPGSWGVWQRYLLDEDLLAQTQMLAIDRPGFGESSPDKALVDISAQARLIMQAVSEQYSKPIILVGHSYAGPIQLQIALDYPDRVQSMIILAGAMDPGLHGARIYHYFGSSWIGRPFIDEGMEVAADEMMALKGNLLLQTDMLANFDVPTTLIQGEDDWLVPPGNADYARDKLAHANPEIIFLPEQNHFLPWREYDLVKSEIMEHLGDSRCD